MDAADGIVFSVLTAVGYIVGLYFSFGRRRNQQQTPREESGGASAILEAFLGGRSLPPAALAISVVASVATAVGVVSFVGHYYAYGFHVTWVFAGIPLAGVTAAFALVPLLYNLRVASIFQYLRLRFDNKVGITACIVYFVLSQTVGAVGIYSSAIAISTMFPVPLVYSNMGIGLAGTIYTALGGLRGVVWADCAQAFVMFLSPIVIIAKVIYDSSLVSPPLRPINEISITDLAFRPTFDMTNDESLWSGLAGALPYSLVRTGFDQMAVQRFMAARSLQEAKGIAIAGPLFVLLFFFLGDCTGAAIIYWFRDCDPVLRRDIRSYDQPTIKLLRRCDVHGMLQTRFFMLTDNYVWVVSGHFNPKYIKVVPYYMMTSLSDIPMLRGLFLAGLVGASTSTVSSIVNSHAAIFYIDVVTPYVKISDKRALIIMRLLAFCSGTIMTLFAIAVPYLGTAARLFMSFYSSASGPFAGLFLLAMSSPWVNVKGIACATLLVCTLQMWHVIGRISSDFYLPPFLPKTLDRCPLNASVSNGTEESANYADETETGSSAVFPLYRISFYWMSFIGAILTIVLGTGISLATGGGENMRRNFRFTSPLFLSLWKKLTLIRNDLKVVDLNIKDGGKRAASIEVEGDELTVLSGQRSTLLTATAI